MKSQHIRVCMYTYVWMCYIHTYIYTRIYGVDEAPDEAPAEPEERGSPKSASTAICCRFLRTGFHYSGGRRYSGSVLWDLGVNSLTIIWDPPLPSHMGPATVSLRHWLKQKTHLFLLWCKRKSVDVRRRCGGVCCCFRHSKINRYFFLNTELSSKFS